MHDQLFREVVVMVEIRNIHLILFILKRQEDALWKIREHLAWFFIFELRLYIRRLDGI